MTTYNVYDVGLTVKLYCDTQQKFAGTGILKENHIMQSVINYLY